MTYVSTDHTIFSKATKYVLSHASEVSMCQFERLPPSRNDATDTKTFHGYPILSQGKHKNDHVLKEMLHLLYGSVGEGPKTKCLFAPRHGLRATFDGKTVDILLCFRCRGIEVIEEKNRHFSHLNDNAKDLYFQVEQDAGMLTHAQMRQHDIEVSKLRHENIVRQSD